MSMLQLFAQTVSTKWKIQRKVFEYKARGGKPDWSVGAYVRDTRQYGEITDSDMQAGRNDATYAPFS